jgi:hypothetical protein
MRLIPRRSASAAVFVLLSLALAPSVRAQSHEHTAGMTHPAPGTPAATGTPTQEAGQAAFAAIAEVVRVLEADSTTDWSRVNLEALRQHLRDMDRVVLDSRVVQTAVDGGVRLEVTGDGEVADAIRRMLHNHAMALESELPVATRMAHHANGLVLTVVARDTTDARLVAKLRALGFAGLLATGNHHAAHHLAIARGAAMDHGK